MLCFYKNGFGHLQKCKRYQFHRRLWYFRWIFFSVMGRVARFLSVYDTKTEKMYQLVIKFTNWS
jgi:hypothetical protein